MPANNVTWYAQFSQRQYNLSLASNPNDAGNLTGAGSYNFNQVINVSASANQGFVFNNWTKEIIIPQTNSVNREIVSTTPVFNYTMPAEDVLLKANFSPINYSLSYYVTPQGSGTATGPVSLPYQGTLYETDLSATANPGFTFSGWFNDQAGLYPIIFPFSMPQNNVIIYAQFQPLSYSVVLNLNPQDGGTANGTGSYTYNTNVTLTATANQGYQFDNWSNNGEQISSQNPYSFLMPANNLNITANFISAPFGLSLISVPGNAGILSGPGGFTMGDIINETDLTVSALTGWDFIGWTSDLDGNNPVSFPVTMPAENVIWYAQFQKSNYNLTINIHPENSGNITGNDYIYNYNDAVSITANPEAGYNFVNWTNSNNHILSSNQNYIFNMPANNLSLNANFDLIQYSLTLLSTPTGYATISGPSTFTAGYVLQSSDLVVSPVSGWEFIGWFYDISGFDSVVFPVVLDADNLTIYAKVELSNYSISLNAYPPNSGFAIANNYNNYYNEMITITASALNGYNFSNWTDHENNIISNSNPYVFLMPANNLSFTANFTPISYPLTLISIPINAGNVSGPTSFSYNSEISENDISYVVNPGWTFVQWTTDIDGFIPVFFPVTMPKEPVTWYAQFAQESYNVSLNVNPENKGLIIGADSYYYNNFVTINVIPDIGYQFDNWTNSEEQIISTLQEYTFNMPAYNLNYTANLSMTNYSLTLSAYPTHGGSVTGPTNFTFEQVINNSDLTATPSPGWEFIGWTTDITGNHFVNFPVSMPANTVTWYAQFQQIEYSLQLNTSPENAGTHTGSGNYYYQDIINISTSPNTGYSFMNWTSLNNNTRNIISNQASFDFIMPAENVTLTANYELALYSLDIIINPQNSGSINGMLSFQYQQIINEDDFAINPATGWAFSHFSSDLQGFDILSFPFECPANDLTWYANFYQLTYNLNLTSSPQNGGILNGSGIYHYNDSVDITVIPNQGFSFLNWTSEQSTQNLRTVRNTREVISTEPNFILTMPNNDIELTANFEQNTYNLLININPENSGTVSGIESFVFEQILLQTDFVITPQAGWQFSHFSSDETGQIVIEFPYSTPAENIIWYAHFSQINYDLNIICLPNIAGSANYPEFFTYNQEITQTEIIITENTGWQFILLTADEMGLEIINFPVIMPAENVTWYAHFNPVNYSLNLASNPTEGGSTSGAGLYHFEDTVTITANANQGYTFINWTHNDSLFSEQTIFSFIMPAEEMNLVANFQGVFNPPSNLTAEPDYGQIILQWNAPLNRFASSRNNRILSGYNIYRDGILIASISNQQNYHDTNVLDNTEYEYFVTAVYTNPNGESVASNLVSASTLHMDEILPPLNVTAIAGNAFVTINWSSPANRALTGYNVYRDNILFAENTQNLTFTDLTTGHNIAYIYSVTALYDSPESESEHIQSEVSAFVNPPTNLIAQAGDTLVNLSWNSPLDLPSRFSTYRVFRNNTLVNVSDIITDTTFIDTGLINDTEYSYKVLAVYDSPEVVSDYSNDVTAIPNSTNDSDLIVIPLKTGILSTYPNPFNPNITITFSLQKSMKTKIEVFNTKGQRVKSLRNQYIDDGIHKINWNGKNDLNQNCPSGIYFIKFTTTENSEIKKILLLK